MPFEFGDQTAPGKVGNRYLRKAIADLVEDPSLERRQAMYDSILKGPLLIAVKEIPPQLKEGMNYLTRDVELQFLTSAGGDKEDPVILAFTDINAVQARAPEMPFIALDPTTVMGWVVDYGFSGIVINPDGPWAGIPKADVLHILNSITPKN